MNEKEFDKGKEKEKEFDKNQPKPKKPGPSKEVVGIVVATAIAMAIILFNIIRGRTPPPSGGGRVRPDIPAMTAQQLDETVVTEAPLHQEEIPEWAPVNEGPQERLETPLHPRVPNLVPSNRLEATMVQRAAQREVATVAATTTATARERIRISTGAERQEARRQYDRLINTTTTELEQLRGAQEADIRFVEDRTNRLQALHANHTSLVKLRQAGPNSVPEYIRNTYNQNIASMSANMEAMEQTIDYTQAQIVDRMERIQRLEERLNNLTRDRDSLN